MEIFDPVPVTLFVKVFQTVKLLDQRTRYNPSGRLVKLKPKFVPFH